MPKKHYSTFGFAISSDFELSLPSASAQQQVADISIEQVPFDRADPPYTWDIEGEPSEITFYWAEAGWFTISNGRSVTVSPIDQPGHGVIEDSLLGECLGVALIQRNELVLHASAIETSNGALIFSGDTGLGKSTLACLALQKGDRVLADDLTLIRMIDGVPHVIPGPSWLKVREAALRQADKSPEEFPVAFDESEKYRLDTDPSTDPVPIDRIVLLEEGTGLSLSPCPQANAFLGLMENSFAAHLAESYDYTFQDSSMRKALFEACEALVNSVEVSVLVRGETIPTPEQLLELLRG